MEFFALVRGLGKRFACGMTKLVTKRVIKKGGSKGRPKSFTVQLKVIAIDPL